MPVKITVRNVPVEVRDALARRAAAQRQSMQGYILGEFERLALRPNAELLARVRERKATDGSDITLEEILEARDADRK